MVEAATEAVIQQNLEATVATVATKLIQLAVVGLATEAVVEETLEVAIAAVATELAVVDAATEAVLGENFSACLGVVATELAVIERATERVLAETLEGSTALVEEVLHTPNAQTSLPSTSKRTLCLPSFHVPGSTAPHPLCPRPRPLSRPSFLASQVCRPHGWSVE